MRGKLFQKVRAKLGEGPHLTRSSRLSFAQTSAFPKPIGNLSARLSARAPQESGYTVLLQVGLCIEALLTKALRPRLAAHSTAISKRYRVHSTLNRTRQIRCTHAHQQESGDKSAEGGFPVTDGFAAWNDSPGPKAEQVLVRCRAKYLLRPRFQH